MALTDNEIIKALECCANNQNDSVCYESKCPLFGQKCIDVLSKNALDLINRQKAEIERLQEIIGAFPKVNMQDCNFVRAEAIKEFAERLIRNVTLNNTNDGYLDYAVDYNCLIEDINDLVKEMVGDE